MNIEVLLEKKEQIQVKILRQLFLKHDKPVSYTHLDVYKRQAFYNSKRIHQSLGYLTPNQFEKVSA